MTLHTVIIGDSRCMREVPDSSVHLVITSPPYWQLKDYGSPRQLGFHHSYEEYINNLSLVWKECGRVLHPGCRLCVNVGDQFARSVYYGRYKVIPIRTEIIKFCESAGFDYMGAVIWRKVTTCNTTGGATIMGSFPYPRNGILKLDYEFILILKKHGRPPKVGREARESARLTTEEWNEYFSGHWSFPGEKQRGHLAMFPEELPRRLIRMFSFEGETVLDPFLGSGTTSLAALNLGRNSIGYEVNGEYAATIKAKLAPPARNANLDSFGSGERGNVPFGGGERGKESGAEIGERVRIEFIEQRPPAVDFDTEVRKLPYIFRDPLALEKKPGHAAGAGYGSKIDGKERARDELHAVKDVLSPVLLLLDDGRRVRLLGVRALPGAEKSAVEFLRKRTKGQKVFLKVGEGNLDEKGSPPCYVYLKNRTFLNAHLLKSGLAAVDDSAEHRLASKFRKLADNAHQKR